MFLSKTFTKEPDIVKRCLRGDRKAQRELYEANAGKFHSLCIRYVKNSMVAEDVMIEGFMKIFEKLPQYEGKGNFEGWMRKIMVTQSLLYLRDNKNLLMEINLDGQENSPAMGVTDHDLNCQDLFQLIAELPVGFRTVFNLYVIEGYSHREIQDMLGISESTSKSQLSRARAALKNRLSKESYQLKETKNHG
ncbi:RNA polymerase sigma factor [Lunatibacter salilacus]|uniref:RNA polymerase sigma factor n=1 Tax=Lunatibacter salilacus TaxID=2483804 RepID=UPI00131E923D|nr:RNA polymerase sigma factor [Lunatibacter salilacus]